MNNEIPPVVAQLQDLKTIRERSRKLLKLARADQLEYFSLRENALPKTVDYVIECMLENYPDLDIPYHSRWRQFEAGGIDRIALLRRKLAHLSPEENGMIFFELAVISVLLDAGAGKDWVFYERETDKSFARSEGLALASLTLYREGLFSSDRYNALRVDSEKLATLTADDIARGFQASDNNPLTGIQGRTGLLNQLAIAMSGQKEIFGLDGRLGNFYKHIESQTKNRHIPAPMLFLSVLTAFAPIWPKRLEYQGYALGDVWRHPALLNTTEGSDFIPFHKLSQWLSYSLIEPLEWTGIQVDNIEVLTGLPEYRNGGLFIDMGVLEAKDGAIFNSPQPADGQAIIEWRGLTVALLDELAYAIRQKLNVTASDMPLSKILQGGTWQAGRKIAREKRKDGTPPVQIISDGTIF